VARPKEFDQKKAIHLFSQQGFASTSTDELMRVMDIGRQSMYDTFGDKLALFLKALEMYVTDSVHSISVVLDRPGSALSAVQNALLAFAERSDVANGCMGLNAISEFGQRDAEVTRITRRAGRVQRQTLMRVFSKAKQQGKLSSDADLRSMADYRIHLEECANCRSILAEEQALSAMLRRSRPLYSASEALSARVSAISRKSASANRQSSRLYVYIERLLGLASRESGRHIFGRKALAASYVKAAVAAHRGALDGSLPPGIQSDSSELVTAWLAARVPFGFRLPTGRSGAGKKGPYRLRGAPCDIPEDPQSTGYL
jgi:TetR/AcrR family transcriptional repressor of nem operon